MIYPIPENPAKLTTFIEMALEVWTSSSKQPFQLSEVGLDYPPESRPPVQDLSQMAFTAAYHGIQKDGLVMECQTVATDMKPQGWVFREPRSGESVIKLERLGYGTKQGHEDYNWWMSH